MTKFAISFIAAATTALPAAAAPGISFERDGVRYIATSTEHDGVQHIVGHEVASGRRFDLIVKGRHVTGTYDGFQVTYPLPATALASR